MTTTKLRGQQIYEFVDGYINENGFAPSYREIAEAVSCSTNTVYHRLNTLQGQGRLTFVKGQPRTIVLAKTKG